MVPGEAARLSSLLLPFLPTAGAAALQRPTHPTLTLMDKPTSSCTSHSHGAAFPEPYSIVPFVPLHGPHTAPGVGKTHITGVCSLGRRRVCVCLPLVLRRFSGGFLLFQRLRDVLGTFLLWAELCLTPPPPPQIICSSPNSSYLRM